jgi:hypothetical protein
MRAPIPIRVNSGRIGRCRGEVEAAVYFCALEAVQNTMKHAGSGAEIEISLERDEVRVCFSIADDGVGIDAGAPGDGVGLLSMRDRVGAVGGELEIVSSTGHGTCVRGTVPDAWPDPDRCGEESWPTVDGTPPGRGPARSGVPPRFARDAAGTHPSATSSMDTARETPERTQ